MTKHTPTPWFKSSELRGIVDDKGKLIAGLYLPLEARSVEECLANMDLILRACNAHDDLVEACNAAAALCENIRLGVRNHEAATPFVRQRLDAALAKAKP